MFLLCQPFACIFKVSLQLCGLYFYCISTCALVSHSIMILLAAHFPRCYAVLFIGDYGNNKVRALDLSTSMVALSPVASCCIVNEATISVCGGVVVCFIACVFRFPPMLAAVLPHPATAHSVRPFATRFLQAHLSYCSACTASTGLRSAACVIVDSSGTMFVSGYCSNVIHSYIMYRLRVLWVHFTKLHSESL